MPIITCKDGSKRWRGPFTSDEITDAQLCGEEPIEPTKPDIDQAFLQVFGERPRATTVVDGKRVSLIGENKKYETYRDYRAAVVEWEQNLRQWRDSGGEGVPPEYTDEEIVAATKDLLDYGMGAPVFFKVRRRGGTFTWAARFPDAKPYVKIEFPAALVIDQPGHAIALYQVQLFQEGIPIKKCHPFNDRLCGLQDGHG